MPLPKRTVSPVNVSQDLFGPNTGPFLDELEGFANGTLANVIRQLSSLSKHSEDMFGELFREAEQIWTRSGSLQARIDRLSVKVQQLDSSVEEVTLQNIHLRKAYKSSELVDQQVVARSTMPSAMRDTYDVCERPPPLEKLNPYRDDGKDGLKFYTDPDYFFDLWRQQMIKDTEKVVQDRTRKQKRGGGNQKGGGRNKHRVRQPHNTREKLREQAIRHGEFIANKEPLEPIYDTRSPVESGSYVTIQSNSEYMSSDELKKANGSIPSIPRPSITEDAYLQYPSVVNLHRNSDLSQMQNNHRILSKYDSQANMTLRNRVSARDSLPPPPPPPSDFSQNHIKMPNFDNSELDLPPPPSPPHEEFGEREIVPPTRPATEPPPPPPPPPTASPPPPPPLMSMKNQPPSPPPPPGEGSLAISPVKSPTLIQPKPKQTLPRIDDARSGLLRAIREGISLRKVEEQKIKSRESEPSTNGLHDVASILARRVAIEFSDTESDSDSSGEWGDETEA
ncbi:actin-binding protein WASF3-like [Artemia franciscana]|uniref:Wiskott-Aldrich syndrome protein family member n=1 Tax=Artemia franciscana TaxID=6661 RepID=A0AA88I6C9_ARTSF|nr:hypothetical protein QYM36_010625 [Artemia franciscana]